MKWIEQLFNYLSEINRCKWHWHGLTELFAATVCRCDFFLFVSLFACTFCKSLKKVMKTQNTHIMSNFFESQKKTAKISKIDRFHVVCGCTQQNEHATFGMANWWSMADIMNFSCVCALCAYSTKRTFVWSKSCFRFSKEQLLLHCIQTILSMLNFLTSKNEWNIEFYVVDFIFRRTCAMNTKHLSIRQSVCPSIRFVRWFVILAL